MTGDDDESKPMTRTELAMLWDLAGRWIDTHPDGTPHSGSRYWVVSLRDDIDAELAERFGG